MVRAAFIHSTEFEQYRYPSDCPFKAERAEALHQTLTSMNLLNGPDRCTVAPAPAGRDVLEMFHTTSYLDILAGASQGRCGVEALHVGLGTPDTPVFRGLFEYAALGVGASLKGAELLLAGEADVVFNASGGWHHAHPAEASGFCYLNDAVLACMKLADAGKRVLFLDVDAHHCDGVQEAFYERSDVMVMSFHESGRTLFPFNTGWEAETGAGEGLGYTVNVPLPEGTDDRTFLQAFRAVALPVIRAYSPDVIVLELGMDCLAGDPMTHLRMTNNAYAEVVGHVLEFGRPILGLGGGGYHPENTVRGWALAWSVMIGQADPVDDAGIGLGGVMLESTDWQGGLRDRILADDFDARQTVVPAVEATVEKLKSNVFPLLDLTP